MLWCEFFTPFTFTVKVVKIFPLLSGEFILVFLVLLFIVFIWLPPELLISISRSPINIILIILVIVIIPELVVFLLKVSPAFLAITISEIIFIFIITVLMWSVVIIALFMYIIFAPFLSLPSIILRIIFVGVFSRVWGFKTAATKLWFMFSSQFIIL